MEVHPELLGQQRQNQPPESMSDRAPNRELKLNLGCGNQRPDGFVNVDASARCKPDILHNLETFPWPFDDNSVAEARLHQRT